MSQADGQPIAVGPGISRQTGVSDETGFERLSELERFAAIGRLSAGLLHEINNPLTAAILWLEQCDNLRSSHVRQARSSIRLLQRYVEAARQQVRREGLYRDFCVRSELAQVRSILAPLAKRQGVRLYFGSAKDCNLHGDSVKFQQIIANLVRNAIDSYDTCPPGGSGKTVRLNLDVRQDYLMVSVIDRGCGIDGDQLSQLFRPFYSTKSATGCGLGIGLSAAKRSVEHDFQGTIQVESSRRGTRFIVRFRRSFPNL